MADANAHNPAELDPEDAPSEVHPFDEDAHGGDDGGGPHGGTERGSSEGDDPLQSEDAPSEDQPFEEELGRGGPRSRDAAGRNRARGRSPEDDAAMQPEDAPSEVQPFDEEAEEAPHHRAAAGQHPQPREHRGRAGRLPRREARHRAQTPHLRDIADGEHAPMRRRMTSHERLTEYRRKRDGYARAIPRRPSMIDELLSSTQKAVRFGAVEEIRKKVYKVPLEQAVEPIKKKHHRWYVIGYDPEREGEEEKRRIIVEGGPQRIDVLFDEATPNSNIHTWVAEKTLEQKGRGPPAPPPSEMRDRPIYDEGICCTYL